MPDCVFCRIIEGSLPASVVCQDDITISIMDINPLAEGHVLAIPKRHYSGLADLDEQTGGHLFGVAMRLARAVRKSGVRCEGIDLFLADGEAAGQEIPHVHLHVFPRFGGDSFRIDADWSAHPSREELDRLAARIGGAYEIG